MSSRLLRQEEIDALLQQYAPEETGVRDLTTEEKDALGEIGNISMGSAATTLSTLLGRKVRVEADMVVLATGITPRQDAGELARTLGISYDQYAFFNEAHPKLRPVETNTAGIYLAGACQGPKDIPDAVAQASGAAAKVTAMFSKDTLTADPLIAAVNEVICSGCLWCKPICPYRAIDEKVITEKVHGRQITRRVATVNAGLCQGCGACTVACRDGAMNLLGFANEQVLAEVEALCR